MKKRGIKYHGTVTIYSHLQTPDYQGRGIAKKLLTNCIEEMKRRKIVDIHLITRHGGFLPGFYEHCGFKQEREVMLMGMELS